MISKIIKPNGFPLVKETSKESHRGKKKEPLIEADWWISSKCGGERLMKISEHW